MAQTSYRNGRNGRNSFKLIVIIIWVLVAIAAVALVAITLFGGMSSGRWDEFTKKVNTYEAFVHQAGVPDGYGDYRQLIRDCDTAINNNDSDAIDELSGKIDTYTREINALIEKRAQLITLKDTVKTDFAKFKMLGDYGQEYDGLLKELDNAINTFDAAQYRPLKDRFDSLKVNLRAENQKQIQIMKNEINTTNTSSATQLEKSSMETYAATVNSYIDEGNYTKALDKLEEWKNLAATIDARSKLEQEMHRNGEDSQEQN